MCVRQGGGGEGGGGRGVGHRIKNKNPTQRCGEKRARHHSGPCGPEHGSDLAITLDYNTTARTMAEWMSEELSENMSRRESHEVMQN